MTRKTLKYQSAREILTYVVLTLKDQIVSFYFALKLLKLLKVEIIEILLTALMTVA